MIPVDTSDIRSVYDILINELRMYNPELLDKKRVLAITKCDMADDEILEATSPLLPPVPAVFISSVSGKGIDKLKDTLWRALTAY